MTEDLGKQITELIDVHKGLTNVVEQDEEIVVSGMLPLEGSVDGLETITDSFGIEVNIPNDFPKSLPRVKETGGRITANYEHRFTDDTLCLAVPIEQRRVFFEQPTLLGFVNRLVIPYLYGYCFWKKHGYHPFDEAAHGCEGIVRHYIDTLGLRDELAALAVISFLFEHGYRGHHDCPCGSGLRVRACHSRKLRTLHEQHTPQTLLHDFLAIFEVWFAQFQKGRSALPRPLQMQLIRVLAKLKRKQ